MLEDVQVQRLPQSKSYLKIIEIPYFRDNTNLSITPDVVESIIKSNYIFNNLSLTSRPRIIKVSSKSNTAIVWIDIWDAQSSKKAKILINRYFNVGRHIATICGTNMNLGVSQCKNCWKQEHTTFVCKIQGVKYIKYNRPHKSEHHHHFIWCYKVNFKINPLKLKTK